MSPRGRKPAAPAPTVSVPAVAPPPHPAPPAPERRAALALAFACASGLVFSIHPASLTFWDPGRTSYWRTLYVPGERAQHYAKIADLIPKTARVASTDFVHPRYTHFERSYDYSDYPRRVADYQDKVPDDTDYIVIDTRHPYSKVRSLEQVRELKTQPDQWDVLPDTTDGAFIVLKRRDEPRG